MKKERINEILGVILLFVGAFLFASIIFNHPEDHPFFSSQDQITIFNPTGLAGAYISHYLILTFGISSYFVPVSFFFLSFCLFLQQIPSRKTFKLIGLAFFIISSTAIVTLLSPDESKVSTGGLLGYLVADFLYNYFGQLGGLILSVSCLFLSFLLATEFLLYPLFKLLAQKIIEIIKNKFEEIKSRKEEGEIESIASRSHKKNKKIDIKDKKIILNRSLNKNVEDLEKKDKKPFSFKNVALKVTKYDPVKQMNQQSSAQVDSKKESKSSLVSKLFNKKDEKKIEKEAEELMKMEAGSAAKVEAREKKFSERKGSSKQSDGASAAIHEEGVSISVSKDDLHNDYTFPSLNMLDVPVQVEEKVDEDLEGNSRILENTLRDFGIDVKVVEVEQGPVITRYEILPAPGVKVSSILNLEHDLALALKATSLRFIAPIPGKSAVGIEIPNSTKNMVYMRELLETPQYKNRKQRLPLVLGKDSSGKPLIADLAEMPHMLIAGTTGAGKTVCVNAIILGLTYSLSPDDLKFVMVDPKMVELACYNKIPHMISPVVTDVRKAANTLNWVVGEMESRYKLLAKVGVRNIVAFNDRPEDMDKGDAKIPAKLPYIVVIIDELADLMMVAQDKVEGAITRLAQLSRAVGIHIILATQRPSVDVITGVIKANFPARLSFKVASKVDSRTVLDTNGADTLLGKGDMLFLEPGQAKPIRAQAAYIKDNEINNVVEFLSDQADPDYVESLIKVGEQKQSSQKMEKDELYDEAIRIVLETGQGSASMLQRKLRLGYSRASRMIDMMEDEGVLGSHQGSKPREILVSRESYLEEDEVVEDEVVETETETEYEEEDEDVEDEYEKEPI